jgi:carbonic anhydrase/acetyltransferase-like protein (isoleucine patch superfamily)
LIIEYNGVRPQIAADAFIAPTATIIGNVVIGSKANIWFGVVLRGDEGQIVIGERVSVQDNTVVHTNHSHSTIVEADVTIGHAVVLEGCRIERGALIGMNATVLPGAVVEAGALVAAGSLVREGQVIPAHSLAAGVPAQIKAGMSESAQAHLAEAAGHYQELAKNYAHVNLLKEGE